MEFTQITRDELPKRSRVNTESGNLLNGFLESGIDLAEVQIGDKKPLSVRSTLTNYIKTHSLPIKVSTLGDRVFLARADSAEAASAVEATDEG